MKEMPGSYTDRYASFNHYHELIPGKQEFVVINGSRFIADIPLIPLLKALNDCGLETRSHNYDFSTGDSFVVIKTGNFTGIDIGDFIRIHWVSDMGAPIVSENKLSSLEKALSDCGLEVLRDLCENDIEFCIDIAKGNIYQFDIRMDRKGMGRKELLIQWRKKCQNMTKKKKPGNTG